MNLIGTGGALVAHMAASGGAPVNASVSQNCRVAYLFLFLALASHVVRARESERERERARESESSVVSEASEGE